MHGQRLPKWAPTKLPRMPKSFCVGLTMAIAGRFSRFIRGARQQLTKISDPVVCSWKLVVSANLYSPMRSPDTLVPRRGTSKRSIHVPAAGESQTKENVHKNPENRSSRAELRTWLRLRRAEQPKPIAEAARQSRAAFVFGRAAQLAYFWVFSLFP